MRAVFVFPPKASPTYVPLGLASLAPYVLREAPGCDLTLLDLNLEAWAALAEQDPTGDALLRFVRGQEGDFYDETQYGTHRKTWNRIGARLGGVVAEAGRYVDTGEGTDAFLRLLDDQAEKALAADPELLGISTLFLDQVPFALALARRVKALTGPGRAHRSAPRGTLRVVLGGAAMAALRTEELLTACPFVDGVVVGEGETGAAALCAGEAAEGVPGLVHRTAAGIRSNLRSRTLSMGALPPADFTDLPLGGYFNPEPVLPVLFSRGCSWRRCRFCNHNASFAGYRRKGADRFAAEIEAYRRDHGARHLYIADQYVGAADLEGVAGEILSRGAEVFFQVMGRPLGEYTPERLARFFEAGCRWISWGVETGSQRLLDLIGKETEVPVMERVLWDAARAGISNLAMMIFGLAMITAADLDQTFRFVENVHDAVDTLAAGAFVLWDRSHFARNAGTYGLAVTGAAELLRAGGVAVHTARLNHREAATDGTLRPPRGPMELALWETRRRWLGDPTHLEHLPCEHYLLYLSRRTGARSEPLLTPSRAA